MQRKQSGFSFLLSLLLSFIVLSVFTLSISGGAAVVRNWRIYHLKTQAMVIDRALEAWAGNHPAVYEESIALPPQGRLRYDEMRTYPKSLDELGALQTEGLFPTTIAFGGAEGFQYAVNEDFTKYRLSVRLPSGETYISPRSTL